MLLKIITYICLFVYLYIYFHGPLPLLTQLKDVLTEMSKRTVVGCQWNFSNFSNST